MKYVFEKSFNFSYSPQVAGEIVGTSTSLLVSARLYSENPTDAQVADSSNALAEAIESVTTWSAGTNNGEYLVPFAAVSDPEPRASDRYKVFYVVVSFRLQTAGTIVHRVRPILLYRVEGVASRFNVFPSTIYDYESKLESFEASISVADKIELAERQVKLELESEGLNIERLDWIDAKQLVELKAVALCCSDLADDTSSIWFEKMKTYVELFQKAIKRIPLHYDSDNDGLAEPDEIVKTNFYMPLR